MKDRRPVTGAPEHDWQRRNIVKLSARLWLASDRIIIAALLAFGLAIEIAMLHERGGVMLDDGYYYLKVAQSIALGKGSTFDGTILTNGYHPLWLLSLVPIFMIAADPGTANLLAMYLQAALYTASIALVYVTARLGTSRLTACLAATIWVYLTYPLSISGLEFSLYALLICTTTSFYLSRFGSRQSPSIGSYFALGILCSLTFLARLDAILMMISITPFLMANEWRIGERAGRALRLIAFLAPALLTGITYLGLNLVQFQHVIPISILVKREWSEYALYMDPVYRSSGWIVSKMNLVLVPFHLLIESRHISIMSNALALIIGSFGAPALLSIIVLRRLWNYRSWAAPLSSGLAPFALYSFLSSASYVTIYHSNIAYTPWYYVIQPWFAALLLAKLLDLGVRNLAASGTRRMRARWLYRIGTVGLIVAVVSLPYGTMRNLGVPRPAQSAPIPDPLYVAALWIRANLPENAIVGSWSAGIMGYFSDRRVINLDGLENSWDYNERGKYDLCGYWRENGINYLADYFQDDRAGSPLPAYPYYSQCADRLELVWSYQDSRYTLSIHIYRISWIHD